MDKKKIKIPDPLKKYVIQDIDKLYVKKDSIAKGGQGTIWLAVDNKKKQYAIKEILVDLNNPIRQIKRYLLECSSLMRAQHPFIVTFCGMTDEYPFQMITEYVGPVNLTTFLTNKHFKSQSNNGTHLTKIATAISNAMMFLHKINIIHRDLKPSNILIGSDYLPRICDFGLVRDIDQKALMTAELGTPIWMAPEVIRGESYSEKCDVFSFSMILYQMATKILPLAELTSTVIMEKYKNELYRPSFPKNPEIPKPLQNLIMSCWNENANERPSFQQIFDKFANGEVSFSYCNTNLIQEFAKILKKNDQNRSIIPPFEIFSYKNDDHSNSDANNNKKKNDDNKKQKEKKKSNKKNSDDDSKSDTDSSHRQNKKKKKTRKNDESSDDYKDQKTKKKSKKIEDNSDENYSDDNNRYRMQTHSNKKKRKNTKNSETDDDYDDYEQPRKGKKKKKTTRKNKSDNEYDFCMKTHPNKKKRKNTKSSDTDDSYEQPRQNNKKKKKFTGKSDTDDDYDYCMQTRPHKKTSQNNGRPKKKSIQNYDSESDTTYKRTKKRPLYNDDKNEPIFEIGTFVTENKPRTRNSSTTMIRNRSLPVEIDEYDENKHTAKMPKFKTHLTNDRKRKPAPDIQFSEPSYSPSSSSESGYEKSANSKYYPIDSPRFTSNSPVSIEALNDVKNPMFRFELDKVKKKDFSKFLKALKNHLTSTIPPQDLVLLLRKTNELLEDDDCLALFSEKKIFEFLPITAENNRNGKNKNIDDNNLFKNEEILDLSIEILNKVCKFYPQFIDEDFETTMLSLINLRPIESAKFLRLYSSSFEMIENPWPLLDMLIVHKKKFNKTESGSILIKTLVNLIQTHKNYKKSRFSNCRSVLTFFLNSPVKKNVISAYKAVTVLYDDKFDLPFKKIRIDMDDADLVDSVISLFDKMDDIPFAKSILCSLMKIAHKNEKAADVLAKMAKNYDSALFLLNSQQNWMSEKLPTFEETLRIFTAATSEFRDLKKMVVADSSYLAALFTSVAKNEQNENSFLCFEKVLNQINFNFDFLENLQENRFFTHFFRGIVEIEDDRVTLSCLRALSLMIDIGICDDYFNFVKNLRKFASRNDKIGDVAQSCIDMIGSSKRKRDYR